jgi:hypothetical protein
MRARTILPVLVLALVAGAAAAQVRAGSAEAAIVELFKAIYAADANAYERITLPDPRRSRLTAGGRRNEERLRALEEDPGSLQIRLERVFQLAGKEVTPDDKGDYPVGTTVRYVAAHQGSPMVVSLVKRPDGWRVDLRWWLAMADLTGAEPPRTSPDYAVKNLLLAMLALNKSAAARLVVAGGNLDTLWIGAPRSREPSGVLEASVVEMPLVEIGPGEFVQLASGRIVEGVAAPDRKVLVGLFGPVEMGFVVRRAGGEWRVEAEPFFLLLGR